MRRAARITSPHRAAERRKRALAGPSALRRAGVALSGCASVVAGTLAFAGFALPAKAELTLAALRGPVPMLDLTFGLTALAAPFLAIVAVLSLAVALWHLQRGRPADAVLAAIFTATMLLVLVARSVALFFVAWEAMSLCAAFLVAAHHERRFVRRTTFVYLALAQSGALCVLAALALLATAAGSPAFGDIGRGAAQLAPQTRTAAFVLALIGFGSKAGLMPLHFWLPRAHPVAPAGASALLSGAMLKVALYGLLVLVIELAAPAPSAWGVALVVLGTLSALGGVLYAVVDRDMKRLLAYSSIENVGIVVLGFGVSLIASARGAAGIATLALTAALFHACNHALFKGLLFLGSGVVADDQGTVDLERLGGLARRLAYTAPFVLIGCAASGGVPPLNGFVSEWLTFRGLIALLAAGDTPLKLLMLAALAGLALTSGLAAACFVKLYGVAFLGARRKPALGRAPQERRSSTLALGLLAALCIAFGVLPALAVVPLAHVASLTLLAPNAASAVPAALPALPFALAGAPLAGGLLSLLVARRRGVRAVPTWTCGSAVTPAAQYTATAFSKPLRTIFAFVLVSDRNRRIETGTSSWFPSRIVYRTTNRYLIDELARNVAAVTLGLARRSRAVQSGSLRLYVAYAIAAVILAVAVAR